MSNYKIKVAGVVTLYNPLDSDISNIESYIDFIDKLYIIDNTEGNSNKDRMPKNKKIEYIFNNSNEGVATALNIGAKKAIKDKYDWLLTMDQDSKITRKNINDMLSFLKQHHNESDIGLISPYHDIQLQKNTSNNEYDDIIEIMTSGNIINLDAYQKIGGFKDWLFIDCVDTDYCMNLHKHGYRVLRLNNVVMQHQLGDRTFKKLFGKVYDCSNHNAIRRYYIIRNNLYIRDMYKDVYEEYTKKLIRIQKGQFKRVLVFEKDKFNKIKNMIRGYIDYKKGIKGKVKL